MEFFQTVWLYLAFAASGAVVFYLYANADKISKYMLLHGILLICFILHMFEERIFPGGFHYIFAVFTGGRQTRFNVMLMNCAAAAILLFHFVKYGGRPWAVGLLSFFGLMEFVLHTIMAVRSYGIFRSAGLMVPYCPGYFTCVFLFLPFGIWGWITIIKKKDFCWNRMKWMVPWMIVISFFTLALPNRLLSGMGDPFPDFGFYEQFLN